MPGPRLHRVARWLFIIGAIAPAPARGLWPSDTAAHVIAARLERHGKKATIIEHPTAGHSPVLPGAPQLTEPMERAWGGTPAADRELGAAAWTEIARRLDLTP